MSKAKPLSTLKGRVGFYKILALLAKQSHLEHAEALNSEGINIKGDLSFYFPLQRRQNKVVNIALSGWLGKYESWTLLNVKKSKGEKLICEFNGLDVARATMVISGDQKAIHSVILKYISANDQDEYDLIKSYDEKEWQVAILNAEGQEDRLEAIKIIQKQHEAWRNQKR